MENYEVLSQLDELTLFNEYNTAIAIINYCSKQMILEAYMEGAEVTPTPAQNTQAAPATPAPNLGDKMNAGIKRAIDAIIRFFQNISAKFNNTKTTSETINATFSNLKDNGFTAEDVGNKIVEALAEETGEGEQENLVNIRDFVKTYYGKPFQCVSFVSDAEGNAMIDLAKNLDDLAKFLEKAQPGEIERGSQQFIKGCHKAIATIEKESDVRKASFHNMVNADKAYNTMLRSLEEFEIVIGKIQADPNKASQINAIIANGNGAGLIQGIGKTAQIVNNQIDKGRKMTRMIKHGLQKTFPTFVSIGNFIGSAADAAVNVHITGPHKGKTNQQVSAERKAKKANKTLDRLKAKFGNSGSTSDRKKVYDAEKKQAATKEKLNDANDNAEEMKYNLGRLKIGKKNKSSIPGTTEYNEIVDDVDVPEDVRNGKGIRL